MKLTDTKLRTLKTPGKHFDGHGLYLEVTQAGGRYWRMKYRHLGKENRLAFGVYPMVSLKEARDKAAEAREQLSKGENPAALRDTAKAQAVEDAANTLASVTQEWLEHQATAWEAITRERITASLELNILKPLGSRPMSSLTPKDIKYAVKAIEARGAGDQASRVLARVKAIFRWAVVHERIAHNPMLDLVPGEILKPREVNHRAAISDRELPIVFAVSVALVYDVALAHGVGVDASGKLQIIAKVVVYPPCPLRSWLEGYQKFAPSRLQTPASSECTQAGNWGGVYPTSAPKFEKMPPIYAPCAPRCSYTYMDVHGQ